MRSKRWLLLCLLFASRSAAAKPGPPPATAPSTTAGEDKQILLNAADEITRQVVALRGLSNRKPFARGVLSRIEIGDKLHDRFAKEYTPGEIEAESLVLKRLGLLDAKADYPKMILDLLMEQVAGFYDPFANKLYIADWLPLEMQRPALAHEIEHALQDEHFDLKRFAEPIKENSDEQLAHAALVEGDGTALMLGFQAQAMGLGPEQLPTLVNALGRQMLDLGAAQTPLFSKAPPFLRETLIFPYLSGLSFVEALSHGSDWKKIDNVFHHPPESTEQVLHPEKYLHDSPQTIAITPLHSLEGMTLLRQDVLGELVWKILFSSQIPAEEAARAAAGWGGDRLVAYRDNEGQRPPSLMLFSSWDSEKDAKEAEAAARKWMAKAVGKPTAPVLADLNGDEWVVERKAERLLILVGIPTGKRQAVATEIWHNWHATKKKQ